MNKTKRQPTEWKKIFVNDISDIFANENLIVFKIYKHIQCNIKKTNNLIKKWAEGLPWWRSG